MPTKATAYPVAALGTNSTQYRHNSGGTNSPQHTAYLGHVRTLHAWAGKGPNKPLVHALVHLGWCAGSGARVMCNASNSSAYKGGKAHLTVATAAAPQVVAVLGALAAAGAPAPQLAAVWATYTGKA